MRLSFYILCIFLTLSSCSKNSTERESNNTTSETIEEATYIPVNGISFNTKDYENWRAKYREQTNDVDMIGIYQSLEEENMYVVFEKNDGHDDAKRFLSSRNFRDMTRESGADVNQVIYYNVEGIKKEVEIPFALGVTHKITNWEKWQKHWETAKTMHEQNGMEVVATARDATNNKLFYIWFAVKDVEAVQSFIDSHHKQNKDQMSEHGVKGSPNMSWWKTMDRKGG